MPKLKPDIKTCVSTASTRLGKLPTIDSSRSRSHRSLRSRSLCNHILCSLCSHRNLCSLRSRKLVQVADRAVV